MKTIRALAVAVTLASTLSAGALPQPISPAEKAAAEAVSGYLARGPVAIYERLASDAPLRSIDRDDALQEIEVRAGEPGGANWTMRTAREGTAAFEVDFPSGVDDLVMFEMKDQGGSWKIASIRSLAELAPSERVAALSAPVPLATSSAPRTPAPAQQQKDVAKFAIGSLLLAMIGGVTRHRARVVSTCILLASAICFCTQAAVMINPGIVSQLRTQVVAQKEMGHVPFAQLRPLLRFRRAMTRGDELPAVTQGTTEVQETARLWRAQTDASGEGSEVKLSVLANTPLFALLRARTSANDGHADEAAKHYGELRSRINSQDAFWPEQTIGSAARGRSAAMFIGSRDAGPYYLQSMLSVVGGSTETARDLFRQAWRMQPMTRPAVVRAGLFAPLLHDPMISVLVNLNVPEESRSADVQLGRSPIHLPAGAKASASGTFVRVTVGRQALDIPGGADIAPRETEIVPASEWDRREDVDALEDFNQLVRGKLTSPSARLRAERTAEALADHNRWADVAKLTESIQPDAETVPLSLLVARVRALMRLHREPEARALAKSPAVLRSMRADADAGTLIDLAELLTQAGDYDDAIETYKQVESTKHGPDIAPRIRQADLRRSLAQSAPTATTTHFEIHSMPDVPVTVAERVGQLLEAELTRVTTHVTLPAFTRVRVNILNWNDFSGQLTGSDDILGFYDGDITIPFGAVAQFREQVVAILTHEMTHAVIAQASDDNAPRWFQEGLARRMELVRRQENIFQNRALHTIPSISILDAELDAALDEQAVLDAYDESGTFMRFLEDRYGPDSINSMIASFKSGANTDEAFVNVLKKQTMDVDREFRDWGSTHSTAFVDTSPWPYTQFYSLGIDPKVREGFHWSKKPVQKQ